MQRTTKVASRDALDVTHSPHAQSFKIDYMVSLWKVLLPSRHVAHFSSFPLSPTAMSPTLEESRSTYDDYTCSRRGCGRQISYETRVP